MEIIEMFERLKKVEKTYCRGLLSTDEVERIMTETINTTRPPLCAYDSAEDMNKFWEALRLANRLKWNFLLRITEESCIKSASA